MPQHRQFRRVLELNTYMGILRKILTDREGLAEQYRDASNLSARMQLHERFGTNRYNWHRWLFDHFDLATSADILELGCGTGILWRENLDRIPAGWRVFLSDLSRGMLEEARNILGASADRFAFEQIDAQALPYPDERFDAVVANHMLYHVSDHSKALQEIRRVLRRGGRLYAATNGRDHLRELGELIDQFDPDPRTFGRTFTLEDGQAELSQWFEHVIVHRREGFLLVTEVEPLVAYAYSSPAKDFLVGDKLQSFKTQVQEQIDRQGAFHISQETGLLEAVKGG